MLDELRVQGALGDIKRKEKPKRKRPILKSIIDRSIMIGLGVFGGLVFETLFEEGLSQSDIDKLVKVVACSEATTEFNIRYSMEHKEEGGPMDWHDLESEAKHLIRRIDMPACRNQRHWGRDSFELASAAYDKEEEEEENNSSLQLSEAIRPRFFVSSDPH